MTDNHEHDDGLADPLAELQRANAELATARKAALNLMEDAILARDALRASEERQTFLLKLSDMLRPLADPEKVKVAAARVLGEHLRVNRALYAEVEGDNWIVARGYEQGAAPLPDGPYSADTFGHWVMQTYRDGRRIVFRDTRTDPRFAAAERAAHAAVGILAAVGVPLVKEGKLVAILAVHTAGPRDWTDAEIGLVEEVAERTWASVQRAKAERALAEEKEYAESIVETLHEPLLVLHPDLTVQSVNPAFYTHFRVNPADTIGRKVYELGNGQWHIPALRTLLEDVLPDSNVFNDYEVTHEFDGLGRRVMLVNGRRLDHVQLILLGIRDITERARAEAALRASEEKYRALVESQVEMVCRFRPDGTILMVNAAYARVYGKTVAELIGTSFWDLIPPEGHADVRARLDALTPETPQIQIENLVTSAHGPRWTMWTNRGLRFDATGRVTEAQSVGVDITERKLAEAALKASEERLRLIVESATDYAIVTLDPDRTVTTWSPGAEAVFGWTGAEMVGRPADDLFTPEDRAAGVPEREADTARRSGRAADERWHLRKDGRRFYASGVLTPLGEGSRGFVKVLRDLTARKRAEEELEERVAERTSELAAAVDALEAEFARRRDLTRRLGTAQEDERRRVARDLHDSLGQLQAGLGLAVAAARGTPGLPAAAGERLDEVKRMADELGRETHALAVRLRPTSLDDLGLEPALRQLVADWFGRTGIGVEFDTAGVGDSRLPADVETAVYRVVQEALTNVAKHAGATAVSVVVTRPDGFVSVVVEDDGRGFDPAAVPKGRLGLLGMRERVELVGGTIDVDSAPGAGTTVAVQIPIPKRVGQEPPAG